MSDDLVKKLRREAGTLATMYEAADEIERLRAALREANALIGVTLGVGPDAVIPELVVTPLGISVKAAKVAQTIRAALENT